MSNFLEVQSMWIFIWIINSLPLPIFFLSHFKRLQGTFNRSFYSLYHTSYETIRLVEEYIDPDYSHHLATTRTFAEMARILADSLVLPFDVYLYSRDLLSMWLDLHFSDASRDLQDHGISLGKAFDKYFVSLSHIVQNHPDWCSTIAENSVLSLLTQHPIEGAYASHYLNKNHPKTNNMSLKGCYRRLILYFYT